MERKALKKLVVALSLTVATGSVMASNFIAPMQAPESTVNIFHTVNGRPTIAKDYFVKISSKLAPEIYELRRCPSGKNTCPGQELEEQSFWKKAGLSGKFFHIYIEPMNKYSKYVHYSEEVHDEYGNVVDYIHKQCTAFAKRLGKNASGTSKWWRGNHIQSSLNGVSYDQAIARDRGKIVMYFGNSANGQYPSKYAKVAGHVGMIVDYIYTNGKPVGMWMVDANFLGSANKGDGRITKHVLMFNNGKSGALNASNYYFMKR